MKTTKHPKHVGTRKQNGIIELANRRGKDHPGSRCRMHLPPQVAKKNMVWQPAQPKQMGTKKENGIVELANRGEKDQLRSRGRLRFLTLLNKDMVGKPPPKDILRHGLQNRGKARTKPIHIVVVATHHPLLITTHVPSRWSCNGNAIRAGRRAQKPRIRM